ncbi:tail fiber protein [Tistrella sp. BH-R2-4]|uniref:Tail fiber protein n=1 Tax=Tistrella arctica TaxID=3133430 RepID=A0ABU9YSA2_9PROT
MNPFIGLAMYWAPDFAPRNWAYCANQLIAISQNTALFSLLGTTYGGNGTVTFALPDTRSRSVLGAGLNPGGSTYLLGEIGGTPNTTLLTTDMPAHTHATTGNLTIGLPATATAAATGTPGPGLAFAGAQSTFESGGVQETFPVLAYNDDAPDTQSAPGQVVGTANTGVNGQNTPISITQPYLGLNIIIALYGIFPPRS